MDLIHIDIVFEDTFSFSKTTKNTTVSLPTFQKMQANDIGKTVPYFDKVKQIKYNYKIISISQSN